MMPTSDQHRQPSCIALELAQQLVHRELGDEPHCDVLSGGEVASAAEQLMLRVSSGLAAAFGTLGATALATRALARVEAAYPMLAQVVLPDDTVSTSHAGEPVARICGLASAPDAGGAPAILHGITAWLAELTQLLSELVGDELAGALLEQSLSRSR